MRRRTLAVCSIFCFWRPEKKIEAHVCLSALALERTSNKLTYNQTRLQGLHLTLSTAIIPVCVAHASSLLRQCRSYSFQSVIYLTHRCLALLLRKAVYCLTSSLLCSERSTVRSASTQPRRGPGGGGDPGRALDPGIRRPLELFPQLARKVEIHFQSWFHFCSTFSFFVMSMNKLLIL